MFLIYVWGIEIHTQLCSGNTDSIYAQGSLLARQQVPYAVPIRSMQNPSH